MHFRDTKKNIGYLSLFLSYLDIFRGAVFLDTVYVPIFPRQLVQSECRNLTIYAD